MSNLTSDEQFIDKAIEEIFSKLKAPINGKIQPKNLESKNLEEKFKCLITQLLYFDKYSNFYKETTKIGRIFTVRKISTCNKQKISKITKDISLNIKLANQNVSSILKVQEVDEGNGCIYVTYEPCELTLETYLKENIEKISSKDFLNIVRGIIDAVWNLHLRKIILKNVQSSNMAYCLDNGSLNVKIFNLTEAEDVFDADQACYSIDINKVGNILFSAVTKADKLKTNLEELNKLRNVKEKRNFIMTEILELKCIESFKKESYAHLVVSMMEAKDSSIHNYFSYSFFWDENKIEECIKVTNSWIDKNSKVSNNEIATKFNKELNYENWKNLITEAEVKQAVTSGFDNTSGELLRFIRNRVVHRKDYKEESGQYFNDNGGLFKYFFEKYKGLFYNLSSFYTENQLFVPHKADIKPAPSKEEAVSKTSQPAKLQNLGIPKYIAASSANADTNRFKDSGFKNANLRDKEEKRDGNSKKITKCFTNNTKKQGSYYKGS